MSSKPTTLIVSTFVTCLVASAGLAATWGVTADRIAEQDRQTEMAALKQVFPKASDFEKLDDEQLAKASKAAGDDLVEAVYAAEGSGLAVRVKPRGYGGPIRMVVGVDRNGKVAGVSIISHGETPGLGSKSMTPEFLSQFDEWMASDIEKSSKEFDAISGASKSSKGIRKGVIAALEVFKALEGGGS